MPRRANAVRTTSRRASSLVTSRMALMLTPKVDPERNSRRFRQLDAAHQPSTEFARVALGVVA